MDGVSSAFAVVSLALQLVETVQEINKFLKHIQDAPKEVLRLIDLLDQLHATLDQVRQLIEQQYLVLRLPGSPTPITKALENCEKQVKALKDFADEAKRSYVSQYKLRRTWASVKFVAKRQDLEDIQSRLRDAKTDLQFAVSSNTWHLQMYQIQTTRPIIDQNGGIAAANLPVNHVPDRYSNTRTSGIAKAMNTITTRSNELRYNGVFGDVTVRKKSRYSEVSNSAATSKKPAVTETSWRIRPFFMSFALEICFMRSFSYIPKSLNVYPIISSSDPVTALCHTGDIHGLQLAFNEGTSSPFVLDKLGRSLLHHAAMFSQANLCAWLLQLGIDSEIESQFEGKALNMSSMHTLAWFREVGFTSCEKAFLATVTVLAQTQDDVSATEISDALRNYNGPPEGVEIILSQYLLPFGSFCASGDDMDYPPLASALRSFSYAYHAENNHPLGSPIDAKRWINFIAKLVRKGADLHARVTSQYNEYVRLHCGVSSFGTPLDELLLCTRDPMEARTVAEEWLHILSSEGVDVISYLEREKELRNSLRVPTTDFGDNVYQELSFVISETKCSVYWDWILDPASSTYLLSTEFTYFCMLDHQVFSPWYAELGRLWERTWPFRYPAWDDLHDIIYDDAGAKSEWRQLNERVQCRANRRLFKRQVKEARSKGFKYPNMPGAWHA